MCDYSCYTRVSKYETARDLSNNAPAGRVEEKVLVWFLNAFDNCSKG